MITEQALMPQIEVIDPINKLVKINLATALIKDDQEIHRINNYQTFSPGQLDAVKAFLGTETSPEIDYITAIWA